MIHRFEDIFWINNANAIQISESMAATYDPYPTDLRHTNHYIWGAGDMLWMRLGMVVDVLNQPIVVATCKCILSNFP